MVHVVRRGPLGGGASRLRSVAGPAHCRPRGSRAPTLHAATTVSATWRRCCLYDVGPVQPDQAQLSRMTGSLKQASLTCQRMMTRKQVKHVVQKDAAVDAADVCLN